VTQRTKIQAKGIDFKQVDREDNWDDFIILQVGSRRPHCSLIPPPPPPQPPWPPLPRLLRLLLYLRLLLLLGSSSAVILSLRRRPLSPSGSSKMMYEY